MFNKFEGQGVWYGDKSMDRIVYNLLVEGGACMHNTRYFADAIQIESRLNCPNVLGRIKIDYIQQNISNFFVFFGNYAENDYLCTVKSRSGWRGGLKSPLLLCRTEGC